MDEAKLMRVAVSLICTLLVPQPLKTYHSTPQPQVLEQTAQYLATHPSDCIQRRKKALLNQLVRSRVHAPNMKKKLPAHP